MKLLITEQKKIISFGTELFNKGSSSNEIVDTDELTVQNIKDICSINEIAITAKKKADIVSQLNDHLVENHTEEKIMSDAEKLIEIIKDGFAQELTDDNIKENMYGAGCKFGDLDSEFKRITTELGLRITAKERAVKTTAFLEGYKPDINDVDIHLAKIAALQEHLKCASTLAGASMRKWAKDNGIELPKAPDVPKAAPGFRGNHKLVADWAIANKDCTFEQLDDFAKANVKKTKSGKDNSRGYVVTVWNAMIFANSWVSDTEVEGDSAEEEMVA